MKSNANLNNHPGLALLEPLAPDTPVWIRMRSDQGTFEMGGKAVWSENGKPQGEASLHGLCFTESSPAQRQALEDLINARGLIRPSRVRLPFEVPLGQPMGRQEVALTVNEEGLEKQYQELEQKAADVRAKLAKTKDAQEKAELEDMLKKIAMKQEQLKIEAEKIKAAQAKKKN